MLDFGRIGGFIGDVIEGTSEAPEAFREFAGQAEKEIIESGSKFKAQLDKSGQAAEQNLRRSKFKSTGANVGGWLSKPMNLIITAAAVISLLYIAFRT